MNDNFEKKDRVSNFLEKLRESGSLTDLEKDNDAALLETHKKSGKKKRKEMKTSANTQQPTQQPSTELASEHGDAAVSGVQQAMRRFTNYVRNVFQRGTQTPAPAADRAEKKETRNKRKSDYGKAPLWKRLLKAALYVVCVFTIVLCVAVVAIAMYLAKETVGDEELLDLNSLKLSYATQLMAKNENDEWIEYQRIYGDENRIWVDYDAMPAHLIEAVVASEDQHFFEHSGVDLKRTAGAMLDMVLKQMGYDGLYEKTQGGSTITQQLIKNITEEDEVDVMRKIREIYRAYQMERRFTKEQILEAYLNTFRLGGQVAGIETGANYYFGTTTKELTTAQCAAIICITKAPTANDPFLNPEENKYQRENVVLWMMHEQGRLTDSEYAQALDESEGFAFDEPGSTSQQKGEVYTYFTDTVVNAVIEDLQTISGYTEAQARELFFEGGLRVYLTVDLEIQAVVEDVALNGYKLTNGQYGFERGAEYEKDANGNTVLDENGEPVLAENQPQGAIVVMNYKGELLGVAGGLRGKTVSLGQNRAVDSVRQTGSSMKPLGAYAMGIEYDTITYSTGFPDQATEIVNGQPWPRNYSRGYQAEGKIPVAQGISQSLNTTAVQALKTIGTDIVYDFLVNSVQISSLVDGDKEGYSAFALGGMTYGISPYEMCAAYTIFGNDGTFTEKHCYTKVVDARGDLIIDKEQQLAKNYAISPQTAMIMNRAMQLVMTGGTGVSAKPRDNPNNLPYAGKTGTTSDDRDFWCIGMNPYYVCTVWEGYDQPKTMKTIRPHPTQLMFREVMTRISKDLEYKNFPQAKGVTTAGYCLDSGGLASAGCTRVATGYYKNGVYPGACDHASLFPPEAAPPEEDDDEDID